MAEFATWLEKNRGVWTRFYDEVIAPNFEQEWKRRTEEHEKALKTKDDNQQILLTHVNNEVIKNARLVEENARLKKLLQKLNSGLPTPAEQLEADTIEATISVNEYRHITDKYNELNKLYQEVAPRIKYLERKNVAVMQKNKEMKENVRAWQEYCDRHLGKQKTKTETKSADDPPKALAAIQAHDIGTHLASSPGSSALRTPHSLVGQERSSPAPIGPLAHVTYLPSSSNPSGTNGQVSSREQADADAALEHAEQESWSLPHKNFDKDRTVGPIHTNAAFLGRSSTDKLGSSQTTEDETVEQRNTITQIATPIEDDDMPQFVSERSLKRKRKRSTGFRVHPDRGSPEGTPARPIRVKEEMFTSSPSEEAAVHLARKETMDLDELGPNVILTPRRRQRRAFSIHSSLTGTLRNQRSSSAPSSGPSIKTEFPAEDGRTVRVDGTAAEAAEATATRAISEPGSPIPRDVLQPLDANVIPKANAGTPNKRIKRERARQQEGYSMLAESSEPPPPLDENEGRRPPKLALAHYNQRVRAQKTTRTPAKTPLTNATTTHVRAPPPAGNCPAHTPRDGPAQCKLHTSEPHPDTHSGAHTDRRPIWSMAPLSEPSRKAPASPPKKQVRLRDKPVSDLTYYDFKPNPKYNQGYTHAFSETVRKRSDRLCLPGCTNATCCGSTFRALASVAPPLTSSQEDELLQDYLGDAYDSFGLTQMSQEERKEVVLQARTRQMAKEHGKHRQAYEGRRSPPGFWRVGFPSTQEQEEDREKAVKMQQEMVQERWLEAMRGNGKWIFRDE